MAVSASAISAPIVAESQTISDKNTLAGDFDSFLLLLTTQLQNQDPLSPLEPTEFTGQLVQFASVEQQINTNATMEDLLKVQNSSLSATVVGFIGTDIEADGTAVPLQDGVASFTYTLDKNAEANVITMLNSSGDVVLNVPGRTESGRHEFIWDGKDANGAQLPDGSYDINITPKGFGDQSVLSSARIRARVTGVNMESGNTLLDAGSVQIPLDKVITVKEPANLTTTSE